MLTFDFKNILAIDPGVTTGIAIRMRNGELGTCVVKSPEEVYRLINPGIDIVVCERFQAQTISGYGLHTVRIVGGVYALCVVYNIKHVEHMPQDRYSFLKEAKVILDERKKAQRQPYMEHEKDALAHLLRLEYELARQGG